MSRLSQVMLLWMVCICGSCCMQGQREQTVPKDGILVGHVFAARPDGSLVPAKRATVVLAPATAAESLIAASGDFNKVLFDAHAITSSLSVEENQQLEELAETERLKALLQSVKPMRDKVLPVFPNTKTDAIGEFTFAGIPSDEYILIAIGHSGSTAGLWLAKLTIEASTTQTVTMSIPVVACYDPEGYVSMDKPDAELDRTIQSLTKKQNELQALFHKLDDSTTSPSRTNTTAQAEMSSGRPTTASPGTAYVDCKHVATQLEAYSAPHYPAPVVASLKCGEQITVMCEQQGWIRVKTPTNVEGYVSFNFLAGSSPAKNCTSPSTPVQVEVGIQAAPVQKISGPGSKDAKESDFNIDFYIQASGHGFSACWMDLTTDTFVYRVSYHGVGCILFAKGQHIYGRFMPRGGWPEVQLLAYDRKRQLRTYWYKIHDGRSR